MNETTAFGLTMKWTVSRGRIHNAANPFTISGYINGHCVMSHGARRADYKHCEKAVIARLEAISKELAAGQDTPLTRLLHRGEL